MHNFKELKVWKSGIELSGAVFRLTRGFPQEERYTLTSQMLRSAISIPSNIAEGCSRKSEKDFSRFLEISTGSSFELETQVIIAQSFGYISDSNAQNMCSLINEVQKMLYGLQKTLIK